MFLQQSPAPDKETSFPQLQGSLLKDLQSTNIQLQPVSLACSKPSNSAPKIPHFGPFQSHPMTSAGTRNSLHVPTTLLPVVFFTIESLTTDHAMGLFGRFCRTPTPPAKTADSPTEFNNADEVLCCLSPALEKHSPAVTNHIDCQHFPPLRWDTRKLQLTRQNNGGNCQ